MPSAPLPIRPTIGYARPQTPLLGDSYIDLSAGDPFAVLNDAYQPDRPQPADAFSQEWMSNDQLVQYLATPTTTPGGYVYNPQGVADAAANVGPAYPPVSAFPLRNPALTLEEELFGDMTDADPEAVHDLIENIKFDQEVQPEGRERTPLTMKSILMEHQKIALTWLLKMERSNSKGGILADEMGLGKTVEALSLMLANPSTNPACKTTLIVAPVALIRQWEKEIERHVKPHHRLKVYNYHQAGRKATFDMLRKYDVVLTTYGTLASELKQKENRQKQEERADETRPAKRRALQSLAMLGTDCHWYRVILDEAQWIKNRKTLSSRAAADLVSDHRWCLTGTPMQNNVDELFSLIRFLQIPPYHEWGRFNDSISRLLKNRNGGSRSKGMNRCQAVLKSIMLRRKKTTIIDGKSICEIPPKETFMESVEFSDAELDLYKAVETKSQIKFNKYLREGTVSNHYANVLVMLLRLRQICCHPHLVNDLGVQVSTEGIAEVDLKERAMMLSEDVVKRLKDHDAFECPICLEAERNPTIFLPCGHTCCGECFQKLIQDHEGAETGGAKCPHCREILSSDKITDYKHFCKVHCPEKLAQFGYSDAESDADGHGDDSDDSSDDDDEDADELDNEGNLKDFVVPDSEDEDESVEPEYVVVDGQHGRSKKDKGKGKAKAKATTKVTLAQLKKQSLRNKTMKRRYLRRLRKNFESSAKVDRTLEILSEVKANDPTEKILIFSQFTTLLDLLEVPLSERRIKYQRYDGSMSINDRADAVNTFMDDPTETIFLISLKAGNAGLNLSKASQVILLDPFWNPFVEEQAVDRAHRMPQEREVKVHRVLVTETVEDRICTLQDQKRELINTALDEGVGKSLTRLSVGELAYLFGVRDRPRH
ncbi:hypothetical protein CC80DRAFT_415789 [Byssothecium circinans]|uniref:SWI/SNF family DNA-dependent ATPase Ris1 n=1 Tax=Byssothecium circinans TaxID=147558 RepID=A0A6A5U2E4_9PLEO|nr:hypothetical protein CC80DRAFT_415789 [Byssothecium circinans]